MLFKTLDTITQKSQITQVNSLLSRDHKHIAHTNKHQA